MEALAEPASSDELYDFDEPVDDEEYILLRYQREWVLDRSPVKVAAKSRQIGITWATAWEAVEVAATCRGEVPGCGMDVYFMSISQEDARQFIDACADWIRWISPAVSELVESSGVEESEDWFEDDEGERILAYRISFPSGHKIYALPSRPARLRGKQGYAICDEAAQQDLDAWMLAAGALLMWGGRLAFISTYFGVDNEFYRLVEDIRLGEQAGSLHEIDIYRALDDGLYRRICRSRLGQAWTPEAERDWIEWLRGFYGPDRFAQECECKPARSGGNFIPREAVEPCLVLGAQECMILEICGGLTPRVWVNNELVDHSRDAWSGEDVVGPDARAATMREWLDRYLSRWLDVLAGESLMLNAGLDYGRTRNISTFSFAQVRRSNVRRARLIVELENMPWSEQDFVQDYLWARLRSRLAGGCADGQGNGSNSAERAHNRTDGRISVVKINAGWHRPQFTRLRTRFEERSFELPRHFKPLVDDVCSLRELGNKIEAPQRVTQDEKKQRRHADAAFSLALLEQSIQADGPRRDVGGRRRRRRRT